MTFSIVKTEADIVRVAICGRLDASMVGVFRRELTNLLRIHPGCVDVDMSRLRFIDNAGVDLLMSFFKDLSAQGGCSVVHGLRPQPLDAFKARAEIRSSHFRFRQLDGVCRPKRNRRSR